MSKVGLHIHSWNHAILQYCKNVGGAVHIILDHNEMMVNAVKRAQPRSLLVARLWVDEQKLDNPVKNAQEFTDLLLLHIKDCNYDAATGYNEWDGDLAYHRGGPEGLEIWKRYADFEAERSRILHREGLLSVVGGCSVGTPPEHWFSGFLPALEEGDFLHLHEYSAPHMWDAEHWHCLKYRHVYDYLKEHGLPILPLIISECGVDGGVVGRPREGWRKFGFRPHQYMGQWDWYDGKLLEDDYVVGSCAFDCGGGSGLGWASFNMDPEMLPLYAKRIKASGVSYWEPKEEQKVVDYPGATWSPANEANYTKGPTDKTMLVLHSPVGSFTQTVNYFRSANAPRVCTHYVLGRGHTGDPKCYQMVREVDIAHHIGAEGGKYNKVAIGIEVVDDKLDWYPNAQIEALVVLCRDIVARNSIRQEDVRFHGEMQDDRSDPVGMDKDSLIAMIFGKPDEDEKDARIAELEKERDDDKAAMTAARNTLDARLD